LIMKSWREGWFGSLAGADSNRNSSGSSPGNVHIRI
jgi:hypothetical protein